MRKLIMASVCVMVAGCSTGVNHRCGLPNLPECVDVHTAYQQSLKKTKAQYPGSSTIGYTPTAQPTQSVDIQRSPNDDGVNAVKTYLDATRPLDPLTGFGPNGVPIGVGNKNDEDLYFATTPDSLPSGYVPPQFVRVWVPRWQNREGDMIHESFFDMILENGHWASGIRSEDLRSKSAKAAKSSDPLAGYVKYIADYTWGRRIWERDAKGNVTITTMRQDTGKKSIQHYPAGTHAPFPLGRRVYPPQAPSKLEQGMLMPSARSQQSTASASRQSPSIPAGAPASANGHVRPPVAPMQ